MEESDEEVSFSDPMILFIIGVNAKVNMYKTANVKMYSGVHVFSFHSSWNEKKTAPYNVSERRMRHEGVNTSRTNIF